MSSKNARRMEKRPAAEAAGYAWQSPPSRAIWLMLAREGGLRSDVACGFSRRALLATTFLATLVLSACGSPPNSPQQPTSIQATQPIPTPTTSVLRPSSSVQATPWIPPTALPSLPGAEATLTAAPKLDTAQIGITNKSGESVQMTVEIADTDAKRQLGLMHRSSMDPNAGMLFVWEQDSQGGFWMFNTILPLSIAFIAADGTIIYIADMQPLDQSTVGPNGPYRYALETNQGFFRAYNIEVGDKVTLPGQQQSVVIPSGMPSCAKPEGTPEIVGSSVEFAGRLGSGGASDVSCGR